MRKKQDNVKKAKTLSDAEGALQDPGKENLDRVDTETAGEAVSLEGVQENPCPPSGTPRRKVGLFKTKVLQVTAGLRMRKSAEVEILNLQTQAKSLAAAADAVMARFSKLNPRMSRRVSLLSPKERQSSFKQQKATTPKSRRGSLSRRDSLRLSCRKLSTVSPGQTCIRSPKSGRTDLSSKGPTPRAKSCTPTLLSPSAIQRYLPAIGNHGRRWRQTSNGGGVWTGQKERNLVDPFLAEEERCKKTATGVLSEERD